MLSNIDLFFVAENTDINRSASLHNTNVIITHCYYIFTISRFNNKHLLAKITSVHQNVNFTGNVIIIYCTKHIYCVLI